MWQKGTPQSMQRAPCSRSSASGRVQQELAGSRARARAGPARGSRGARSAGSRRACPSGRVTRRRSRACTARRRSSAARRSREHALVVVRHDLHEGARASSSLQAARARARRPASRCARACSSTSARSSSASASASSSKPTMPVLQRSREVAVLVEHVGDAAAHAGGEVAPGRAEHDHAPAGHVLAAVVADALDDRAGAGVAHREALAGEARGRTPARRSRRRARCCRRSRSPRRRRLAMPARGRTAITPPDRPLPA